MSAEAAKKPRVSWVVATLCFVGAQFVVVPFLLFLALVSDGALFEAPGAYVTAALLLAGGVAALRARPGLFAAQLVLSGILCALGLLVFAQGSSDPDTIALALATASLTVALLIDESWIQSVLGFLAAFAMILIFAGSHDIDFWAFAWFYPHPLTAALVAIAWTVWIGTSGTRRNMPFAARIGAIVEGFGVAVALALLYGGGVFFKLLLSGREMAGSTDIPLVDPAPLFRLDPILAAQCALTAAAFAWLVWRQRPWPRERRHALGLLGITFALLALFGSLAHDGGALAVLIAGALAERRPRMLALAGLVLLVKLSAFYYALRWPLVDKATLLAAMGAALGAALWLARRRAVRRTARPACADGTPDIAMRPASALAVLAASVAALGAVHWDVRGKENVIADGSRIFIALAPRDPRSLMQGDYMALDFAFPRRIVRQQVPDTRVTTWVVASVDERGVAAVVRHAEAGASEPLAPDEVLLPLKWMNRGWTLVTDAFYFPEGQGAPLARACFGEFRVLPDGRALLVGLADEHLQAVHASRPLTEAGPAEHARPPER